MSPSSTESGSAVDIEARLTQLITSWYPDRAGSSSVLVFRRENVYRWSRHLLYEIVSDNHGPGQGLLVKQPRLRDSSGRSQFEDLNSGDPLGQEFRALSLVYQHLQSGDSEAITAVRPLAHLPDLNALVLEYLPGQHLLSLLLRAGAVWAKPSLVQEAVNASYTGGILLRNVHQIRRNGYPKKESFNTKDYIKSLEVNLDLLLGLVSNGPCRRKLQVVEECLKGYLNEFGETGIVSHLHGDLYPENLVRLPDGPVYIVDTTLQEVGPIEHDIAKFIVGVSTTKRRLLAGPLAVRPFTVEGMNRAFVAGYRTGASFCRRTLMLCTLLAYLRRWTEVILALRRTTLARLWQVIQSTRIDPFLLACIESNWDSIKMELKLS